MLLLHTTIKACLPKTIEAILLLLGAFLLGMLFRHFLNNFFGGNNSAELEAEVARYKNKLSAAESKLAAAPMAASISSDKEAEMKTEIEKLVVELEGSKNANGLLRARVEDLENNAPVTQIGDMTLEQEEEMKREVIQLVEELKAAKGANELLRARLEDVEEATRIPDIEGESMVAGAVAGAAASSGGHIGDMTLEQEEEMKKEVIQLVQELKSAKGANELLRARLEDVEAESSALAAAPSMDSEAEENLKSEVASLVEELKGAKEANVLLRSRLEDVENNPSLAVSPLNVTDAEPDDLTKIEGIGPKIAGLCNDIGIMTFQQLSITSVERLKEMLEAAGPRYRVHNPSTWPAQASLASQDLWDQLNAWQDVLDGGKA